MTRPNTFISVGDVRATPSDLDFVGNISFNLDGQDFADCAFLLKDTMGRLSISLPADAGRTVLAIDDGRYLPERTGGLARNGEYGSGWSGPYVC